MRRRSLFIHAKVPMIIEEVRGNILNVTRGIIVHGCNATAGEVSGLAAQVFAAYPEAQVAHNNLAMSERFASLVLGKISVFSPNAGLYIVNAITQSAPGGGSLSYDAMIKCFDKVKLLAADYAESQRYNGNLPIVLPRIGAGIAGGNWNIIRTIIEEVFVDNSVILYTL